MPSTLETRSRKQQLAIVKQRRVDIEYSFTCFGSPFNDFVYDAMKAIANKVGSNLLLNFIYLLCTRENMFVLRDTGMINCLYHFVMQR
jgi:hypothetical protein